MKIAIILLCLLGSVVQAADKNQYEKGFDEIDAGRRGVFEATKQRLSDLNYARMKNIAVSEAWESLVKDYRDIQRECAPSQDNVNYDNCSSRINLVHSTARVRLAEIEAFENSSGFREYVRKPVYKETGLEGVLDSYKRNLRSFIDAATPVREKMARLGAEADFQRALARMKEKSEQKRLEIQCALMPPTLQNKFVSAQLARREAEMKSDPHLIIKADLMATEIQDASKKLKEKCPANLAELPDVSAFLKDSPSFMAKIPKLAKGACAKVGVGELKRPCEREDFNPSVLFSLHQALRLKQ